MPKKFFFGIFWNEHPMNLKDKFDFSYLNFKNNT
jgi:hypothetical protein